MLLNTQNNHENIEKLKAMRQCYSNAKIYNGIRIIGSISIALISIILTLLNKYNLIGFNLGNYISLFGSLWLVVFYMLEQKEASLIEKGAKMQEAFDTNIFKLNWNKALVGKKVKMEEVYEFSQAFKGNESDLKNWYNGLNSKYEFVNVILSQRSNLMWALSLKKNFGLLVSIFTTAYLILTIFISSFTKITLADYMSQIFIPSISIMLYGAQTSIELWKQSLKIEELGEQIEDDVEGFINNRNTIDMQLCRQYQDAIYVYNRTKSVLIPDWLYWLRRREQDNKMIEVNVRLSEKSNNV